MSRLILTAVALFGFGAGPQAGAMPSAHKVSCATVDAQDIGKLPLALTVGTVHVEFTEWTTRDLGSSESVGFRINSSGPLTWVAESGPDRAFTGSSSGYIDELALVKPSAPTLSRVTFCDGRQ